jgi:hypothetical protein
MAQALILVHPPLQALSRQGHQQVVVEVDPSSGGLQVRQSSGNIQKTVKRRITMMYSLGRLYMVQKMEDMETVCRHFS